MPWFFYILGDNLSMKHRSRRGFGYESSYKTLADYAKKEDPNVEKEAKDLTTMERLLIRDALQQSKN